MQTHQQLGQQKTKNIYIHNEEQQTHAWTSLSRQKQNLFGKQTKFSKYGVAT